MKLLITAISLLILSLGFAYANDSSIEEKINKFKSQTLKLTPGMSEGDVLNLFGQPEITVNAEDDINVSEMKAIKGLVYWHPAFATIHLLIGITNGIVVDAKMCRDVGSRIHKTECESLESYWNNDITPASTPTRN